MKVTPLIVVEEEVEEITAIDDPLGGVEDRENLYSDGEDGEGETLTSSFFYFLSYYDSDKPTHHPIEHGPDGEVVNEFDKDIIDIGKDIVHAGEIQ